MKASLLTSSSMFGKYLPNTALNQLQSDNISAINLKQNFAHERPFTSCKFDVPGNRLYLLDTNGILIHLNLHDNSFSTLKSGKIQNFTIDGSNSLNVLYVTQKSQLYQVSFQNKKPNKITNLNMNRIRAFQRNYLRDMLLSLDYKLLFLCDITKSGPLKVKSLKAKKDQVFTNACFSSNNRFIILAIKNIQIRIIEIMDLKSVHEIKLPFVVNQLKIQVSYDSKRVAIYGDCNIIFFINLSQNQTYSYELIQIPFVKSVLQLRYTSENDIVFLGSDQILYTILANQPDKAVPIFNEQFQVRMMNFDISLDCTKIALVSNRTVMQLRFLKGLRRQVEEKSSFKQLEYRKNGFQSLKATTDQPIIELSQEHIQEEQNKKIQYQDEDGSQQDLQKDEQKEKVEIFVDNLKSNKNLPRYKQQCGSLHSHVSQLKGVNTQIKAEINSVLNNILNAHRDITKSQIQNVVIVMLKLIQDYKLNAQKCFKVLDFVIGSVNKEREKFRHYGLVLCPQIVAIIQKKLGKNFTQFCQQQILGLFSNYFIGNQWKQAINWLLSAGVNEKIQNLPLLLICILQEIHQKIIEKGITQFQLLQNPASFQIKFNTIYNRVVKVYLDQRYKYLFKRRVSQMVGQIHEKVGRPENYDAGSDSKLQKLIIRQDQIKKALTDLKKAKGNSSRGGR